MPGDDDAVDESEESPLNFEQVKEVVGFVIKTPLRHKKLALFIFAAATLLTLTIARSSFKTYHAAATILLQKNVPIQRIANPQFERQDADSAAGMVEQMLKHDALLGLVRDCHLVDREGSAHSILGQVKDGIKGIFIAPENVGNAEMEEVLATRLTAALTAWTDGTTLTIAADWWNEETAFDLVKLAEQHFFRDRAAAEIAPIAEAIALLNDHAKDERQAVDEAIKEFEEAKRGGAKTTEPPAGSPSVVTAAAPRALSRSAPKPELDPEVQSSLAEKRRQIREMEDDRSRRLTDLKSQLARQLATYTPAHPAIVALESQIDALTVEPAALTDLRKEERRLLGQIESQKAEIDSSTSSAGVRTGGVVASPSASAEASDGHRLDSAESLSVHDPTAGLALAKLRSRIRKYEELMDRITAANMDLDAAKATFKYRYSVFKPAEVLSRPKRTTTALVMGIGLLLAGVLAVAACVAADLASGRLFEPWQARRLGLPVIGEITKR